MWKSRILWAALIVSAGGISAPVTAQNPGLREGARVRVTTPSTANATGVIGSIGSDSLVVLTEPFGAPIRFPRADISKIEASQGRLTSEGAKRGAIWGGIIGLTAGVIALLSVQEDETPAVQRTNRGSDAAFVAANTVGMILGGAAVGALIKAERWNRVDVGSRVSVGARVSY